MAPPGFGAIPDTAFVALRDVIVDSYDKAALKQTIQRAFNRNFDNEVAGGAFNDQVYELLEKFDQRGLLDELLQALVEGRPDKKAVFEKALHDAISAAPIATGLASFPQNPKRRFQLPSWALYGLPPILAISAAFAVWMYWPSPVDAGDLVIRVSDATSDPLPSVKLSYFRTGSNELQTASTNGAFEHHIPLKELDTDAGIVLEPKGSGPAEQNAIRCFENCYRIVKIKYADPRTIFLYLEEVRE